MRWKVANKGDTELRKKNLISRLVNGGTMCMVSIISAAAGVMALPMLANAESAGNPMGG